ncbi:hypothetical protein [Nostoc sp. PA-18-2419]|uniref:hypothetical protein n=1 Tax=Nostoc sp. PA-18-2419 TaxID=2575443 RepID=UPI001677ED32|nr:hypothetical protein [Nostoc sp. PA-18-2419]
MIAKYEEFSRGRSLSTSVDNSTGVATDLTKVTTDISQVTTVAGLGYSRFLNLT